MNVLLLNPPLATSLLTDSLSYPPLGILTLSSFLRLHGHQVQVLDLAITEKTFSELLENINDWVEVVGITVYTEILPFVVRLVDYLKGGIPGLKVVLGGPHCSVLPRETLEMTGAHVVVSHEGEAPLLEVLAAWQGDGTFLQEIDGICYQEGEEIRVNRRRGRLKYMNLLPLPDREAVDLSSYHDPFSVVSSRGCPGQCVFCATRPVNGAEYRARGARHVYGEVVFLHRVFGAQVISFLEDTFLADGERFAAFVQDIKGGPLQLTFRCETRIDQVTKEMLETMAEIGFDSIQYGIETGDQQVMEAIRKGIDLAYAEEMIGYTKKVGIRPMLSFCLGHYADTLASMEKTVAFIQWLVKRYAAHIAVSFNTPFPGTYQYNNREALGLFLRTTDWSDYTLMKPITYTRNYSVKDLYRFHFQILTTLIASGQISKQKEGVIS